MLTFGEVHAHRVKERFNDVSLDANLAGGVGESVNYKIGAEASLERAIGFGFQFIQ